MSGPNPRRSGMRLWVYLAALLAVSALCVAPFAIVTVASATSRSATAHRMQEAVRSVVALEAASDALNSELLPSVLLGLLKTDVLRPTGAPHSELTLGALNRITIGMKSQVRDATDDALRPLETSQPTLATETATQLRSLRAQIDAPSVTTADLQDVYSAFLALADQLNSAQSVAAETALERGVHLTSIRTVQDITEIAAATLSASRELPAHFMDATGPGHQAALVSVGLTWAQASRALDPLAEPSLRTRWQALQQSGTLSVFDTALAQPLTSAGAARGDVNRLLALNQTRSSALSGLLYQGLLVADRSAVEVRHQANLQLYRALGLVALLVLTAFAAVVTVSQAIARPLRRLSAQAREISEGHLVDIDVTGLHEVQAASLVLSSMADNLRRIEGQSAAVAAGDLSNPLLEEPLPGPLGEVVHSSVTRIVTAVREREALQAELTRAATHDALTGLANRPRLLAGTEFALEHRELGGPAPGLLFIDLDGFKAVNDTLGHAAGDQLLTVVARRLEACARTGDLVARLGGDEFVLLIGKVGHLSEAVGVADRLIDQVSRPITLAQNGRDTQVRVGASIGISVADDPLIDAGSLFAQADSAVYTAKAKGRGCYQVFDEALRIQLRERQDLETALIRSVGAGEFRLDYVPVAEIATGRQLGWDARAWWVRPGHDPMPAAGFLPLAQATRRIGDIDRWALVEAVRQLRRWDEDGEDAGLTIAVTVSLARLLEPDLVDDVLAELEGAGLAPSRLILNVPEAVLNNGPTLRDRLGTLRQAGLLITVDDFGRDAAPLGLLAQAPVDRLRLHGELIHGSERSALLRAVLDVSHAAGLTVVARDVDRADTLERLRRSGCDLAQGSQVQPVSPRSWPEQLLRTLP